MDIKKIKQIKIKKRVKNIAHDAFYLLRTTLKRVPHDTHYLLHTTLRRIRLRTWIALGVLFIIGPIAILGLIFKPSAKAEWFDENWTYRQPWSFTHNAALTNRRVGFTISNTNTLVTAGKLQSTCNDIRFTDSTGSILKIQLTGSCNAASTTYDVIIPNVINGLNVGYVYYGNPNATSVSQDVSSFTSLSPSGGAPAFASEAQGPGPIAYWKFDEGVDNTCSNGTNDACDTTSGGNDGAISNGAAWKPEDMCINGKCLFFDGVDDVVTVTQAARINLSGQLSTGFTISAWVRPNGAGEGSAGEIFNKGTNTYLRVGNLSNGKLDLVASLDEATNATVTATGVLNNQQWNYVAMSFTDDGDDEITLWVNGKSVGASTNGVGPIDADANNLLIGGGTSNNFQGFIDEFKIYSQERTSSQILTDYANRGGLNGAASVNSPDVKPLSNGLVGYWKLDEPTAASSFTDYSGNGTTLIGVNHPTFAAGKYGNGADLESGNLNFLIAPDNATLSLTSSLTVASWIRPESTTAATQFDIAGKWGTASQSYLLAQYGDELRFYIGSASNYVETTNTNLATATWYQVIATYDASSQIAKIYVNGTEQATTTNGTIPSSITDNADAFQIGSEGWNYSEVSQSSDDAKEAAGTMTLNGTTLEADATNEKLGFRFQNIAIAQAATVQNAYMVAYIDNAANDEPNHPINAQAADNAGTFTSSANDITNRTLTSATTTWSSTDLGAPGSFTTPALTSLVQEVVNRAGWASGNSMVFVIVGSATATRDLVVAAQDHATDPSPVFVYTTSTTPNYYDGIIDETRVYNRRLNPNEIKSLYNFAPGPVGYWKFDEGSGTTVYDRSGTSASSKNGTWQGTAPYNALGKYGGAGNFNNTDSYVSFTATRSDFNYARKITAEAWFYDKGSTNSAIFGDIEGTNTPWVISLDSGLIWATIGTTTCNWGNGTPDVAVSANTWHHVAFVYDGDVGQYLYLDGVLRASNIRVCNDLGSQTILIGAWEDATIFFPMNGYIDDVRLYNYVRTPGQIIQDMNGDHPLGGSPIASQVAYFKFDEQNGQTINNSNTSVSLTAYRGTTSGSESQDFTWKTMENCKLNGCGDYDGIDDVTTVTNTTAIDINDNLANGFTFSTWINPDTVGEGSGGMVFSKGANTYCQLSGSSPFTLTCNLDYVTTDANVSVSSAIPAGSWSHVALTFNSSANTISIWINGKLRGTSNAGTGGLAADTSDLLIGNNSAGSASFDGRIDEFKIYSADLSQAQMAVDADFGGAVNYAAGTNEASLLSDGAGNPPVGYWNFDENTDNTCVGGVNDVCDKSGNGNDGSWNGTGNPHWTQGKIGTAGKFNGSDDYIQIPDNSILRPGNGSWTVSLWAKPADTNQAGVLISKDQATVPFEQWSMYICGDTSCANPGQKLAAFFIEDGGILKQVISTSDVADGNWHQYTMVADKNFNDIILYMDGKRLSVTSAGIGSSWPTVNNTDPLRIGVANSSSPNQPFTGPIDDVKVYNYARTQAQVAYDYNRGGPVGWWKFDECQGTTANDASGNGNNGTLTITGQSVGTCTTSSTAWGTGANGKFNSSIYFDGNGDFMTTSAFSPLATAGQTTTKVSWGGWFYPTASPTSITLMEKATEFRITTDASNNAVCGIYYSAAFHDATSVTAPLTQNAWNHVLCTYDGANILTYINGVLKNTTANTNNITAASSIFYVGENSSGAQRFTGQVDDVRIYNYNLSASQVKRLYNGDYNVRFGPSQGSP
jgi:hypothetical protein